MHESAERKDQQPGFPAMFIEVKTDETDNDEKEQAVAEYPPVTESLTEEECSYGFVNYIGQERTYKQEP